jgi:transposase
MQPNRAIFNGLIHMARSGGQWSTYPREFAAKSTAFDRFTTWVEQGSFQAAWTVLLEEYDSLTSGYMGSLIGIEWAWQSADGCAVKAPLGKKGALVSRKTRAATQRIEEKAGVNDTF